MLSKIFTLFTLITITLANQEFIIGSDSISFSKECCEGCCQSKLFKPILELAFPNKTLIWTNDKDPDLVIRSPYRNPNRKKYTCPYINHSGEPKPVEYKEYPPIIEINTFIDFYNKNTFYIPHIINADYTLPHIRKYTNTNRPYLIAYMNTNCQYHREKLFELLLNKFGNSIVHALGPCSNNRKIKNDGTWYNAPDIYKDYSFVFAMENTDLFGYITEKIMNAYIAGSIPIFWGSGGKIRDFFNKKSFIDVQDFLSFTDCADYIGRLTKKQIYAIQTAPVFENNIIPSQLILSKNETWMIEISDRIREKYYSLKK